MATTQQLDRLSLITRNSLPFAPPELPLLAEMIRAGVLKQADAAQYDVAMRRWYEGFQNVLKMSTAFQEINTALKQIGDLTPQLAQAQTDIAALQKLSQAAQAISTAFVLISGSVMTGFLTLSEDPVLPMHAATKEYVDAHIPTTYAEYTQSSPANPWVINHTLGHKPSVTVWETADNEVQPEYVHASTTQVIITFSGMTTGTAKLSL